MKARWTLPLIAGALVVAGVGVWWSLRAPAVHPDAARYTQRQPGLPLVHGYTSYASVAEVNARLAADRLEAARRTLARPPDPRYPPRDLDTLTVDGVELLGGRGRLSLQFFNDRLFEIDFRPDDAAVCVRALRHDDALLKRDANGRAERSEGDWRVATNVALAASDVGRSLATEPYVLWQDLRLVRERDDWDARFGAIPYRLP